MSNILNYILNLKDGITDKINKISSASDKTTSKMQKLEKQTVANDKAFNNAGKSAGNFSKLLANITPVVDVGNIASKVVEIGVGITKSAMSFDEGMAKINTTAQLPQAQLDMLKDRLTQIGLEGGADLLKIPESYEKIISQTGNVNQSIDILQASVKGSKAGFTDLDTVTGAVAQTMSLVSDEGAKANEIMDTFFAAKRVGAGEFKDFAQYMPNLIASGKALGVTYKNTAGLFAYMTGKGFSAEKSSTLLENAFTAFGKSDIQGGLKGAGINVFDKKGQLRNMDVIFGELHKKMAKMSDNKKSNFLESIGLKDAQAKSAFMALSSDSEKLKTALDSTNKSAGETDKAFDLAQNPMMKVQKLMSNIQYVGLKLGTVIGYILSPALDAMNWLFDKAFKGATWWMDKLREGSPIISIITGLIGSLVAGYTLLAMWEGIVTVATLAWEGAQWLLNASLTANPVGLIIAGIVALIALISYVVYKTDGWGKAWEIVVNNAKLSWNAFTNQVKYLWEETVGSIMNGISKIQIGWYKFKNTVGLGDKKENNQLISKANGDIEKRKKDITAAKSAMDITNKLLASGQKNAFSELKWNEKRSLGDLVGGLKKKIGLPPDNVIAPAKPPGGILDNSAIPDDEKDKKKKDRSKTNEAIATGGTRHNYITINLKDLIGVLNISGKDFKDSSNQMKEQTEDALVRVLAMATTAGI